MGYSCCISIGHGVQVILDEELKKLDQFTLTDHLRALLEEHDTEDQLDLCVAENNMSGDMPGIAILHSNHHTYIDTSEADTMFFRVSRMSLAETMYLGAVVNLMGIEASDAGTFFLSSIL